MKSKNPQFDGGELAACLKALSDPTRLKIVMMLSAGECALCVNTVSKKLKVTQSAVSQHLRILKQVNVVRSERRGYHVYYSVEKRKIKEVCGALLKEIC